MSIRESGASAEPSAVVEDAPEEQSPFRPTRITEGYPYDDADEAAIERILSAVKERNAETPGTAAG